MIPDFDHNGVLPPTLPGRLPTDRTAFSPYLASPLTLINHYGFSNERIEILKGLFAYRKALKNLGFVHGIQWLDGSFVEDCERWHSRSPNDIDIVTLFYRPDGFKEKNAWDSLVRANAHLFNPKEVKRKFSCDAYLVDLSVDNPVGDYLPGQISYWYGLFSHQRSTRIWKGMIKLELHADDTEAISALEKGGTYAAKT